MKSRYFVLLALLAVTLALLLPGIVLAQPAIPHTLEGRSACTTCHTVGGAGVGAPGGTGLTPAHQGRTDATCTGCHQAAAAKPAAQATATPAPAKPAATATTAPAAPAATPAAPGAAATPVPAKPAATATPAPTPGALPRTGGLPVLPFVIGGGTLLATLGWALRRTLWR